MLLTEARRMLRIVIVDDDPDRSLDLRMTPERREHAIVAGIVDAARLYGAVREIAPDAIIIDTDSPTRDTLEHLCLITGCCPRPIVRSSPSSTCSHDIPQRSVAVRSAFVTHRNGAHASQREERAHKAFHSVKHRVTRDSPPAPRPGTDAAKQ